MKTTFNNLFVICDPFTPQGLSNNTTFNPLWSGATIPLYLPGAELCEIVRLFFDPSLFPGGFPYGGHAIV